MPSLFLLELSRHEGGCGFVERGGARFMSGADLKMFAPNLTILQIKKGWELALQLFPLVGIGNLGKIWCNILGQQTSS